MAPRKKSVWKEEMYIIRVGSHHKVHVLDEARAFSLLFGSDILLFIHHFYHQVFGALGEVTVGEPETATWQFINSSELEFLSKVGL